MEPGGGVREGERLWQKIEKRGGRIQGRSGTKNGGISVRVLVTSMQMALSHFLP